VGSGFEPHWRPQPAKLPSFGGYSLETSPPHPYKLRMLRAGGRAHAMESRLSTLATCGFGVWTSLEAQNRLSCLCSADTAMKP